MCKRIWGVNMKKVELLAPAGSFESLVSAIQSGADAVYLAGKNFGARRSAANFTLEELKEAADYCHLRGKKLYLTVNTLVKEKEIEEFVKFMDQVYPIGIDAYIVQDLGMLNLMINRYKDIELHGSTQMTLNNSSSISEAKKLGLSRVVLPRELETDEIKNINNRVSIDTEVFIHGALCISYSGQCLMSSMIGGRSGNRGGCAQACRQKYSLVDIKTDEEVDNGFLLSPKDIMTIENLGKILDAGVRSLKIEGRLKKPEYNGIVVSQYRKAIDDYYNGKKGSYDLEDIEQIFNRDFTSGYILGDKGQDIINKESPTNKGVYIGDVSKWDKNNRTISIKLIKDLNKGDELHIRRGNERVGTRADVILLKGNRVKLGPKGSVVTIEDYNYDAKEGEKVYRLLDTSLMAKAREGYNGENPMVPLDVKITLTIGKNPVIEVSDDLGNKSIVEGDVPCEKAINRPMDKEKVITQLSKLGNTPFYMNECTVELEEGVILPVKALNNIRRSAVEEISEKRISSDKAYEIMEFDYSRSEAEKEDGWIDYRYVVSTIDQIRALSDNGVDEIFVRDFELYKDVVNQYERVDIYPVIPRIIDDSEVKYIIDSLSGNIPDKVISGSLSMMDFFKENNVEVIGDFSLNIYNHCSCDALGEIGFSSLMFSPELNRGEIEKLMEIYKGKSEFLIYGYLPVMTSKYCPKSTSVGCSSCDGDYSLKDKTGAMFPVVKGFRCKSEILNSKRIFLLDSLRDIEKLGIDFIRMDFYNEDYDFVNGLINAIDDEKILEFKSNILSDITKGHYFRGVQ